MPYERSTEVPQQRNGELRQKAHTSTEDLSGKAHEMIDKIATSAEKAEAKIRQATADAEAFAKKSAAATKEKANQTRANLEGYVHEHPLVSLGIAFGAGALAAAILKRSK